MGGRKTGTWAGVEGCGNADGVGVRKEGRKEGSVGRHSLVQVIGLCWTRHAHASLDRFFEICVFGCE